MKKRLYRKLRRYTRKVYKNFKKRSINRRVKLLTAAVCGMLRTCGSHMSNLGYGLPQKITAHSQHKTMKGFLENKWVDYDTFYRPFINKILKQIFKNKEYSSKIKLIIDGSKMGSSHMALMISLWYEGRGIPLVWLVRKKPKGHFKEAVHLEVFKKAEELLQSYLTPAHQVIFMGDGEFDGCDLQQYCKNAGWDFVFRTAENSVFYENETRFQPKDISVDEKQQFYSIPDTEFTEEKRKKVHFVLWHTKEHENPLPLISNLSEPIDIIEAYRKRYSIEAMFKDIKSTTFNVHKTRLTKAYSISNLIMIAAISLVLLIKVGQKYQYSPLRKYVNRLRKDQKVNTLITYGRDYVKYSLDNGETLSFSYKFSKNSS